MSDDTTDFYEDDEPPEKVRAAFERGEKGFTARRPRDVNQLAASIVGEATERPTAALAETVPVPGDLSSLLIESVSFETEGKRFDVAV